MTHPERVYLASGSTKPWIKFSRRPDSEPVAISSIENIWVDNKINEIFVLDSSQKANDPRDDSFHPDAFFNNFSKSILHVRGYCVHTIKRFGVWPETTEPFNNRMGISDYWLHMASGTNIEACDHPLTITFNDLEKVPRDFRQPLVGNRSLENTGLVEMPSEWTGLLAKGILSTHACVSSEEETWVRIRKSIDVVARGRFVITQHSMGFTPRGNVDEGDIICIIYGCSVPVILKHCTGCFSHFNLVVECYIQGIMEGEYMQKCLEKGEKPEEIKIL